MNNRKKNTWVPALLIMACLAVTVGAAGVQAQDVICLDVLLFNDPDNPNDADGDGLSDYLECTGLNYTSGPIERMESCQNYDLQLPRGECIDPNTKDIFVILLPSTPMYGHNSYIFDADNNGYLFDPLAFANKSGADGGLGLTTHLITQEQATPDRSITFDPGYFTKAVIMRESLAPNTVLGTTIVGTPLEADNASIFTGAIAELVESEIFTEESPKSIEQVRREYIQHTFSHELGHNLTEHKPATRKDGNHMPGGSEWVMERFVAYKYSKKDEYTTFYTGTVFTEDTQAGITFY